MDISVLKLLFDNLYSQTKGYELSYRSRKKLNHYNKSYTYGEIDFDSFAKLLASAGPRPGETFYDLGSGSGKAVIAAAMLCPFAKACGVEILEDLYRGAEEIRMRFVKEVQPHLGAEKEKCEIKFINSDFNMADFSDADVIFIHATCFDAELGLTFMRKISKLKPGTRIITASKRLHLPDYKVNELGRFNFSWGQTDCYLHTKTS